MFYAIKTVQAVQEHFSVHLANGTSFKIVRPDFSDINDTIRFQYEMLSFGIHPVELEELMFTLIIGLLFDRPIEVYSRA